MEIKGIVKQVGKTEKVNDKFTKRELILKTEHETKYPQYLVIQFTQGNVSKLDSISPGELVTVSINLKGREWSKDGVERYFNTIEGWNIKKDGETKNETPSQESSNDNQDLPF